MTCKLNCKRLCSSQCGALFFTGGMGHFYRPGGDFVSSSSMLSSQTVFRISNPYFFPVIHAGILVDQICMDWEFKTHHSTTLVTYSGPDPGFIDLKVAKYDRWEVSNGVPSILKQSTKLSKIFLLFILSRWWELSNCFLYMLILIIKEVPLRFWVLWAWYPLKYSCLRILWQGTCGL